MNAEIQETTTSTTGIIREASDYGGTENSAPGTGKERRSRFSFDRAGKFLALMPEKSVVQKLFRKSLLERAIGVIYRSVSKQRENTLSAKKTGNLFTIKNSAH